MPLPSYAVKHQVSKDNPSISTKLAFIKVAPLSYTSNHEGKLAEKGKFIYVIEVIEDKKTRRMTYWLSYKYRAFRAEEMPGGDKWDPTGTGKNKFIYKNTPMSGSIAEGLYFKKSVQIKDLAFLDWYRPLCGMREIKAEFIPVLEKLFDDPSNDAQEYE